MKRQYIIPFMIITAVILAVSISGCSLLGKSTPEPKPTLPPAPEVQPTLPPAPEMPTLPPAPEQPKEPAAPVEQPTTEAAKPAEQPQPSGSDFISEDFQEKPQNWSYKWVTGNTQEKAEIRAGGGVVKVIMPRGEESAVKFFKDGITYDNVVAALKFRNFGDTKNGVSVLCRVNDKGFYEFRMSSGGLYSIYRYDNALKEDGKNPYVFIGEGASQYIVTGLDKENTLEMDCTGKSFEFYLNGKKIKTNIPLSLQEQYLKYPSGGVGFGVFTYNETAGIVDVEINHFETRAEH